MAEYADRLTEGNNALLAEDGNGLLNAAEGTPFPIPGFPFFHNQKNCQADSVRHDHCSRRVIVVFFTSISLFPGDLPCKNC